MTAVLTAFISFTFAANPGKTTLVKGTITDKTSQHPISYSSVALFDKSNNLVSYGTLTDNNGKFYLKNLPYGKYNLQVYLIGYYKKHVFNIEISKEHPYINLGNLKIEQNDSQSYNFEVVGKKIQKTPYVSYKELKNNSYINNL